MLMKVFAKINTRLAVIGRLADGYHALDMLMSSVEISDNVRVLPASEVRVSMDGNNCGRENSAYRAAQIVEQLFGLRLDVEIAKGIPLCAGLGGSSADAAAVLFAADKLRKIDAESLMSAAMTLGSDVAYMLRGGDARVGGRGEDIEPTAFVQRYYVVAQCDVGASTAEVYAKSDALSVADDGSAHFNALEASATALCPSIAALKSELKQYSDVVFMTGSGSAVVAQFPSEEAASNCQELLRLNCDVSQDFHIRFVKAAKSLPYGIIVI